MLWAYAALRLAGIWESASPSIRTIPPEVWNVTNGNQQIVQRLWNYCNILRDDGLSYGDYIEQLTYLLSSRWPTSGLATLARAVDCPGWLRLAQPAPDAG